MIKIHRVRFRQAFLTFIGAALLAGSPSVAQVAVHYTEGEVHGFLVLKTLEGTTLAEGDLSQVAHGDRVTSELTFHFKDGSIHDETSIFSQRHDFHLLNYHLVQKGPSFPHPMEVLIDGSGQVTVHYTEDGKEKEVNDRLKLPPDVANGMLPTLLKNLAPNAPQTTVSMVAAAPKPRLVKLEITPKGDEPFSISGASRKATHYSVKVVIGGAAGAIAPIVGKQPPDIQVWILRGESPAFLRLDGPLYVDGPVWRVELAAPVWPQK